MRVPARGGGLGRVRPRRMLALVLGCLLLGAVTGVVGGSGPPPSGSGVASR